MKNLVLIAGVSGAGKSYLEPALQNIGFIKGVTSTTRPMRIGEIDGVHYNFKTDEDFLVGLEKGEYIESAEVNGSRYGMLEGDLSALCSSNPVVYMILDPQGVKRYQDYFNGKSDWSVKTVFLNCPLELRLQRIADRVNETATDKQLYEVAKRLIQTRDFEEYWKDMVTAEVYIHVSKNAKDIEDAVVAISEAVKQKTGSAVMFATREPLPFTLPTHAIELEMEKLKKGLVKSLD
ncbi:guanylate kinase [Vibrio crassostreae]|uniref:guanylate kinase n=1 Tax=Vibrio crassostreae TaxID=246167 RepID=UPI001B3080C6